MFENIELDSWIRAVFAGVMVFLLMDIKIRVQSLRKRLNKLENHLEVKKNNSCKEASND